MKTIIASVKPFKLDEVKNALGEIGIKGFRVIEVKGFGNQRGHTALYRGAEYVVDYLPRIDIVVTVQDEQTDSVVQAMMKSGRVGRVGDGRITVMPTEQFWNIRTGENEATATDAATT